MSAFDLVGVSGFLYQRGIPDAITVAGVGYDDPRVRWVRAGQLIVGLRDFTITDLNTEAGILAISRSAEPW